MEDMFRGMMLTTEVMLKPKVTINYPVRWALARPSTAPCSPLWLHSIAS